MKKLFLVLILLLNPLVAFAEIDERKTDVYFANGILTSREAAIFNTEEILEPAIIDKFGTTYYTQKIGEVTYAYNETHGFGEDIKESAYQIFNITEFIEWRDKMMERYKESQHHADIEKQVDAYEESIKKGHKVLVVAHSQGNLFTQEAYERLGQRSQNSGMWLQEYFEAVSIASPDPISDIKPNMLPRIGWDNDLVARMGGSDNQPCSVRHVTWEFAKVGLISDNIPPKPTSPYVHKSQLNDSVLYKEWWKPTNGFRDNLDSNVHAFTFYMGLKLKEGDDKSPLYAEYKDGYTNALSDNALLTDNSAKILIMEQIKTLLDRLEEKPSQWKRATSLNDIPEACLNRETCESKKSYVEHMHDAKITKDKMAQTKVLIFEEDGKLYQADGRYVKAPYSDNNLVDNPRDGVCYALDGMEINGKIPAKGVKINNGALVSQISWNYLWDIDMDLSMSGPNVVHDVKDVEGLNLEHAYVASQFEINPNTTYSMSASGTKASGSTLPEFCLDKQPVNIYAMVKTPSGSKFRQYQAKNFSALNIGMFAEIEVKEKEYDPVFYSGGSSGSGSGSGIYAVPQPVSYTRPYNKCVEEEYKKTCGCVPCEYIIRGMNSTVEYGPIAGASVSIVSAEDFGKNDAEIIFRGSTTEDDDIFQAGLIEFTSSDKQKFDDNVYYVVSAEGGVDIDRNDDLIRDDIPTQNRGTIHAIIKGSDLKTVSFRVNVLSEAAFQVSGELLGDGYDANLLEKKLHEIATKLIKEKTYPINGILYINYHDVLLWAPGVDKPLLFKDYDTFVEPLVLKTYADEERFEESYSLIYDPINPDAPLLASTAIKIPYNTPPGSIIGKVGVLQEGNSPITSMALSGEKNEAFSIDASGVVRLVNSDVLVNGAQFSLKMHATNENGLEGIYVGLMIEVEGSMNIANPDATIPYLESIQTITIDENADVDTIIATVIFNDTEQTIVDYNITGTYKDDIRIETDGTVHIVNPLTFDYEKAITYEFTISAINDAGNESLGVPFSIKVRNVIDTPLFDLVFFDHIQENRPKGTVVGHIQQLRDGLSPVTSFDILNPNVPFSIDTEGTITISGPVDYESRDTYDLTAIARSDHGDSNEVDIQIYIDNQYPEVGIPTLQAQEISIPENTQAPYMLGRLDINDSGYPIESISISGLGHNNFSFDTNGTISLRDNALLDYETKNIYQLKLKALNAVGYSKEVTIKIFIENIADTVPILNPTVVSVNENTTIGTKIGQMSVVGFGEGLSSKYILSGDANESFRIDTNGSIFTTVNLDFELKNLYQAEVLLETDIGKSNLVDFFVEINNVDEAPILIPQTSLIVLEDTSIGSVITSFVMENTQDSPIDNLMLEGVGKESFRTEGNNIILSQNLNYQSRSTFHLKVQAENIKGLSEKVDLNISVLQTMYTGTNGNDTILGSERSEHFRGGLGNDRMVGSFGDDYYHYTSGDGNDTIEDIDGFDRLYLHEIQRDDVSFILNNSDLFVMTDINQSAYIKVFNWKEDTHKIEEIIFDDGQIIEVSQFNQPIVKPDIGVVDISKLGNAQAAQVAQGYIVQLDSHYNKVDHWEFYYQGGNLIIDMLSELANNGQSYIDLDLNGVQNGVDIYIHIFKKDSNSRWQLIASNDDSSSGKQDGSSHRYDSYLNLQLDEGFYLLAVGSYPLSSLEALNGKNDDVESGPYQITLNKTVEFSSVPISATDNLYGSDQYNFYALNNDIDGYNIGGLRIENPEIVDENGTRLVNKGYVEVANGFISYYPEDNFQDLIKSEELNIIYDVRNRNDIIRKSLLTLYIIPSHYTHVTPILNEELYNQINITVPLDLNITYLPNYGI